MHYDIQWEIKTIDGKPLDCGAACIDFDDDERYTTYECAKDYFLANKEATGTIVVFIDDDEDCYDGSDFDLKENKT